MRDGGVIATGHDAELDELRAISDNCDDFLLKLEARERERTGIANLRVQFNRVHGFYIEVTQSALAKVPDNYRRRQTLKNAERFITPELKAFEDKALSRAGPRPGAREVALRAAARRAAAARCTRSRGWPARVATLDALCALAERSHTLHWRRRASSRTLHRDRAGPPPGGRSAAGREVVGRASSPTTRALGPQQRMQVITGPNMGGKSTYMRQVAIIVLLASIGSHVPAAACRLGPIDAIHTRIGAADDLAERAVDLHAGDDRGRADPARRHARSRWC